MCSIAYEHYPAVMPLLERHPVDRSTMDLIIARERGEIMDVNAFGLAAGRKHAKARLSPSPRFPRPEWRRWPSSLSDLTRAAGVESGHRYTPW